MTDKAALVGAVVMGVMVGTVVALGGIWLILKSTAEPPSDWEVHTRTCVNTETLPCAEKVAAAMCGGPGTYEFRGESLDDRGKKAFDFACLPI